MNKVTVFKGFILLGIFSGLLTNLAFGYSPRSQKIEKDVEFEADSVYELVYDHYSDILEDYYKLDQVLVTEKDYYQKKLLDTIIMYVNTNRLPLYGNAFSRFWRNITAYSANNTPLKKFDYTSLEDAIGHLDKHYQRLIKRGTKNQSIEDLVFSLNNIRNIVRNSLEYKYEELYIKNIELENLLVQERSKSSDLEKKLLEEVNKNKNKYVIYEVTKIAGT